MICYQCGTLDNTHVRGCPNDDRPVPERGRCGGRLEGCDCSRCRRGVMPVTDPELDRFFYRG